MKVSIVIPVYNVQEYLVECLESAINQTLEDIEIIAVNDGSTDSSLTILESYKNRYSNIRVIDQVNKGLSGARNSGLKEATGEYIYFLDSDDYIDLKTLEICYKESKKYNLDIISFDAKSFLDESCDEWLIKEDFDRAAKLKDISNQVVKGEEFFNMSLKKDAYIAPVWLSFYRREFIIENNLYFYEGIIHEDELHTPIAYLSAQRMMYIPLQLFFRRVRENSIMTKKITTKNVESLVVIASELYKFYKNKKDYISDLTASNLFNQIRYLFSVSFLWCDNLDIEKNKSKNLRDSIKINMKETKGIVKLNLLIHAYFPNLYYTIKKLRNICKDNLNNGDKNV